MREIGRDAEAILMIVGENERFFQGVSYACFDVYIRFVTGPAVVEDAEITSLNFGYDVVEKAHGHHIHARPIKADVEGLEHVAEIQPERIGDRFQKPVSEKTRKPFRLGSALPLNLKKIEFALAGVEALPQEKVERARAQFEARFSPLVQSGNYGRKVSCHCGKSLFSAVSSDETVSKGSVDPVAEIKPHLRSGSRAPEGRSSALGLRLALNGDAKLTNVRHDLRSRRGGFLIKLGELLHGRHKCVVGFPGSHCFLKLTAGGEFRNFSSCNS